MEKIPFVYRFCRFCLLVWMKLWLRYSARGGAFVPPLGGCIVASNHASFLDPVAVGCGMMHRHVRFMARDSLFRKQPADWWADAVGVIRIDRTRGDLGALKDALAVLRRGGLVCLFPEGTRTMDGELQKAQAGIAFLMAKGNVPVVPAYIHGTFKALPRGARWVRPCKVSVIYGEPIPQSDLLRFGSGRKAYRQMADMLMERIASLKPDS